MSLPPTSLGPPNTVCVIQPGMIVQPVCVITPPSGATLSTTSGGDSNVSVNVQPGMLVKAIVWVDQHGNFVSHLGGPP